MIYFLTLLIFTSTLTDCTNVRRQLGQALINDETEMNLGTKFAAEIEAKEKIQIICIIIFIIDSIMAKL